MGPVMSIFLVSSDECASLCPHMSSFLFDCAVICLVACLFDNRRRQSALEYLQTVTPGVEHTSYVSELPLPASRTTASRSNNKSYASNETGCLAEEHSRRLQMVTFGFKRISYEPELSLWALNTVASKSTTRDEINHQRMLRCFYDPLISYPSPVSVLVQCAV